MARLIEVHDARACPTPLVIRPGDVLMFTAVGGRLISGGEVAELSGPFTQAVVGDDGDVYSPAGPPNRIIVSARRPGRALIEVFTAEPFSTPHITALKITVE